jgi:hypothetical protein
MEANECGIMVRKLLRRQSAGRRENNIKMNLPEMKQAQNRVQSRYVVLGIRFLLPESFKLVIFEYYFVERTGRKVADSIPDEFIAFFN